MAAMHTCRPIIKILKMPSSNCTRRKQTKTHFDDIFWERNQKESSKTLYRELMLFRANMNVIDVLYIFQQWGL